MDAGKCAHMASIVEYIQSFLIICLMVVCGFEYLMISMLTQQIDETNERLITLLDGLAAQEKLEDF